MLEKSSPPDAWGRPKNLINRENTVFWVTYGQLFKDETIEPLAAAARLRNRKKGHEHAANAAARAHF